MPTKGIKQEFTFSESVVCQSMQVMCIPLAIEENGMRLWPCRLSMCEVVMCNSIREG